MTKHSSDRSAEVHRIEFDGARYRRASTHQKEWGSRLISELVFQGNEDVLDVGCGDGVLTAQLADLVPAGRVLGIDASSSMIDTARTNVRPNLSFLLLDVTQAEFSNEFDIVFSNATLHWVHDHGNLLQILHRALKDGGVLRTNFGADGNCPTFFRVARQLMDSDVFRSAFRGFRWPYFMPLVESYERLVMDSPFADVRVWGENADRHFPDVATMLRWLDQPAILPFKRQLDSETAERFHAAVAARMERETIQPDGTCFEAFERVNVFARKQSNL
ncbi:MAG: methyltransferase type 11 [Planctomycetaceae bacterium]|jgi:trans-aconitate methyltransferase|nr:methyltransferase type 11 [Planctomycetaceae bacterium]